MSRRLSSMVQKIFDKKISGGTGKNEIISNKELAVELRKPITRKFEKKKYIHLFFYRQYFERRSNRFSKFNSNMDGLFL